LKTSLYLTKSKIIGEERRGEGKEGREREKREKRGEERKEKERERGGYTTFNSKKEGEEYMGSPLGSCVIGCLFVSLCITE
jgi:hypothetical protein